ncbi:hypothetical protein [Methylomagnum ishizawai]|uniref:hypothetical protein n=1 Tax=Methylomagnum ishizawai TaxID=1760988 RepID=UPI001C336A72|nr:hypothetical protein [Methylomagnum ishizawai]BBL77073.1 hypothetical protein MishRS11D_41710 [Methylomagnum ishizawai]
MPQLQSALLGRADVPTRAQLQEALREFKFKLDVDAAYAPFQSVDYLPCTLNGEDGGVKLRFDAVEPYLAQFPELDDPPGQRDTLVTLRSGGDPREDVCVLMLAAVLAAKFGALVHDPKKNATIPADKLLGLARSRFAELD